MIDKYSKKDDVFAAYEALLKQMEEMKNSTPEKVENKVEHVYSPLDRPCTVIHMKECGPGLNSYVNIGGRGYTFNKFGESKRFAFRDLQTLCSTYRTWFERGILILGSDCEDFADDLLVLNIGEDDGLDDAANVFFSAAYSHKLQIAPEICEVFK